MMKANTKQIQDLIKFSVHTPEGKRVLRAGATDPALVWNILRQIDATRSKTVESAINEWKRWLESTCNSERTAESHITYATCWAREKRMLGRRLAEVREHHISEWINERSGCGLATRRVRLSAIRSLFKFCSIREYITMDPSQLVRVKARLLSHEQKEPTVRVPITDDEIRRILAELDRRIQSAEPVGRLAESDLRFWRAAIVIGRHAGLRLGDIACLEWSCLSKPGKLIVWTDKHDARVDLPMTPELRAVFDSLPRHSRHLCFPSQDKTARDRKKRSKLSVQFGRLLESIGIEGKSFHCLRHAFATDCRKRNMPMPHIQESLGHANQSTTKGYIHE